MNILLKNYNKSVNAYIKEFERRYEVELDYWISDEIGGIAAFGDYTFNFIDIKYAIDKSIKYRYLIDWYNFIFDFGKKCFINLDSYCRLRRDAEQNEYFELLSFEKSLIYMRVNY
jgi:hypothetical protein